MWDLRDEDKAKTRILPFERDAFAYIKIIASPLKANLISGGMNYITRGKEQFVTFEPKLYTFDPDYPEDGVGEPI